MVIFLSQTMNKFEKTKKQEKKKERKESKQLYAKGRKVFELKDLYRIQVS